MGIARQRAGKRRAACGEDGELRRGYGFCWVFVGSTFMAIVFFVGFWFYSTPMAFNDWSFFFFGHLEE